jgi:hypothetical protein
MTVNYVKDFIFSNEYNTESFRACNLQGNLLDKKILSDVGVVNTMTKKIFETNGFFTS